MCSCVCAASFIFWRNFPFPLHNQDLIFLFFVYCRSLSSFNLHYKCYASLSCCFFRHFKIIQSHIHTHYIYTRKIQWTNLFTAHMQSQREKKNHLLWHSETEITASTTKKDTKRRRRRSNRKSHKTRRKLNIYANIEAKWSASCHLCMKKTRWFIL